MDRPWKAIAGIFALVINIQAFLFAVQSTSNHIDVLSHGADTPKDRDLLASSSDTSAFDDETKNLEGTFSETLATLLNESQTLKRTSLSAFLGSEAAVATTTNFNVPDNEESNPNQKVQHCTYQDYPIFDAMVPPPKKVRKTNQKSTPFPEHLRNKTLPQIPTFIIGGAQKTGTTTLLKLMYEHPKMVTRRGEIHYFDWRDGPRSPFRAAAAAAEAKHWNTTEEEQQCYLRQKYMNNFPAHERLLEDPSLFTFDKTPSYLATTRGPELVKRVCPWIPKIIFTLRHPVDRFYSHISMTYTALRSTADQKSQFDIDGIVNRCLWNLLRQNIIKPRQQQQEEAMSEWNTTVSSSSRKASRRWGRNTNWMQFDYDPVPMDQWDAFEENPLLNSIGRGLYAAQLSNWFNHYPRDAIKVFHYNELKQNTTKVYHDILDFVGIPPPEIMPKNMNHRRSSGYTGKAPKMSNTTRAFLDKFYQPWNAQLEGILGEEWKGVWQQ